MKKLFVIIVVFCFSLSAIAQTKPSIDWVSIPAGSFTMGSPKTDATRGPDEIQHQVTISAFKMSKYEITFEQYDAFCRATGRELPSDEGWGRGRRPVINVTWDDASAFATWMGCRLPTEAEWEYACRAGSTTAFNTGNNLTTDQSNYNGNYPFGENPKGANKKKTTVVGTYLPNAWGLFDMHGNVWEWCSDWYGEYPTDHQTDPKGPVTGVARVSRGGSWYYGARYCRSANRRFYSVDSRYYFIGIRLVAND